MIIRIIGISFVMVGCFAVSRSLIATHRRTENELRRLYNVLERMEYELQYRCLPLPELLEKTIPDSGIIKEIIRFLLDELNGQVTPKVSTCVNIALGKVKNVPEEVQRMILRLGECIGQFDLENQVRGISNVRNECANLLDKYIDNQDNRLRSYQVLALCAGAAIVITLI